MRKGRPFWAVGAALHMAALFGLRPRVESEFPKKMKKSGPRGRINKERECARRLRQAPWGISPLRRWPEDFI